MALGAFLGSVDFMHLGREAMPFQSPVPLFDVHLIAKITITFQGMALFVLNLITKK